MKQFKVEYSYKLREGRVFCSHSIPDSHPTFLREVARIMKSVHYFSNKPGFKFEISYG